MSTDILFTQDQHGDYDISFDENGDITNGDFFDTSLLYSLLGERRASAAEVPAAASRRGWIGNEGKDFENGSKLWLYEQERLTRTVLNRIEAEARAALQWLIDDGFLAGITARAVRTTRGVGLELELQRFNSIVDHRFFELWENTGA